MVDGSLIGYFTILFDVTSLDTSCMKSVFVHKQQQLIHILI